MFATRFGQRLKACKNAGLYRDPPVISKREGKFLYIAGKKVLNFASNDYLGLGTGDFPEIVARNFKRFGASSSSSRLVSGNFARILEAESAYADYFGYDEALFFPSGYQANLAVFSTFFENRDLILFDKRVHASTVKGMVSGKAEFKGYNHNDMEHLDKRLRNNPDRTTAVATESLFSMDGDFLPVSEFRQKKKAWGFLSVVDEAHAFGSLGPKGRGIAREAADLALGTFGKALGFFGAFVLLPSGFREYLYNFCSPLIYTTTLPEAHAASAMDLLEILFRRDDLREKLSEISRYMKKSLLENGFYAAGDAHILAVPAGSEDRAARIGRDLLEKGFLVLPARYPTVPLNKAIFRISLTADHTREDIVNFVNTLKKTAESCP